MAQPKKPDDRAILHGIDKDARRESTPKDCRLHAKALLGADDDPGTVEGYAAIWNNVDLQGEIMRRGCFAKTIDERVNSGRVKLMAKHFCHGGDALDCIGTIQEMREDEIGLYFRAEFAKTQIAQDLRQNCVDKHVKWASIGFMPVRWGYLDLEGKSVLEHLECKASEVTLTVKPVNEQAMLLGAKSLADGLTQAVSGVSQKLTADLGSAPEGRVSLDSMGGRDAVEALGKALDGLAKQVRSLLSPQPPAGTEPAAGPKVNVDLERRKLHARREGLGV